MGQYHFICNIDRQEYLHPHDLGDGLKLMEFGASGDGAMLALAVLLAEQNKGGARGGGDLHPWTGGPGYEGREVEQTGDEDRLMSDIVGRWAGDRIAIIGDYWEDSDPVAAELQGGPWSEDRENGETEWTNISADALAAIRMDHYVNKQHAERWHRAA